MLKSRRLSWLVATGLVFGCIVAAGFYLLSPWRGAEVALGVRCLPWSVRNLHISEDAWTDYLLRGYMEVSPADFEGLLKARSYDRKDFRQPSLIEETVGPKGGKLYASTAYSWSDGTSQIYLQTDASRSWVYFSYSTD